MRRQRWSCLCPQPRAYLCTQGQPHGLSSEAGRAPVRFSSYHPCQLAPEKRLSAHTGYNLTGVRLTSRWHLSFLVSPQLPAIHSNTFSATDTPGVPSGLVQLCLPHGHPAAPSDADQRTERAPTPNAPDWIGGGCRFEVVEDQIELEGYQIYAVEKCPQSSLSPVDAYVEWDKATRILRTDGARPKETSKGTLFVTSLANFRSDYTIVHIPNGNFLDIREQLYTNINLLRMGCSGRSALTLEEPSDTTKDRFVLMYEIPDKALSKSGSFFNATVLELVKLIQAALAIFDMFDLSPEERNGLLCDVTSEGIKRWVTEVGEQCMKVEHMERVADPTVVAALLSLILTVRNKLHALGYYVPKDPFLDPQGFTRALAAYHAAKPHGHAHAHHLVHGHPPRGSSPPGSRTSPTLVASSGPAAPSPSPNPSPIPTVACLSHALVEAIHSAYEKKARQNESYKVHRVLKSKLDDLASDLRTGTDSGGGGDGSSASGVVPTADMATFVKVVVGSSKDAPHSLRYLWTGRPEEVGRKRREKEAVWSDAEREEREKDGERDGVKDARDERDKEMRSSGDESEAKPWPGRVQRKIESWAALGRTKKLSVDFGVLGKSIMESPNRGGPSEQSGLSSTVPSVRVTGETEEPLSSGQVSPTYDSSRNLPLGIGSSTPALRSESELLEYDRRIFEFNKKRPLTRPHIQSRVISWSDPVSAKELVDDEDAKDEAQAVTLQVPQLEADDEAASVASDTEMEGRRRRRTLTLRPRRCRSFDAAADLRGVRVLPTERMRIDVDLCGQLLVMRRREQHLANVVACLSALTARISHTNTRLRADHEGARPALDDLRERARVLQDVEAARTRADGLTQETHALAYESAQFLVEDLWHMAAQPRRRVLAMREKAFGTGRRHPQGVRGADGRVTRVQWTLDGRERLVDALGRTESEAEEEEGLLGAEDLGLEDDGEEVDAVENQSLRPTWLLKFFNYWGSKWKGTDRPKAPTKVTESDREDSPASGSSTSLPPLPEPLQARPSARQIITA
ncbi:hypothetical protein IEO21_00778 [Rhodonia placenta]|uniref:STB6-like N-terminal domain-containing protein n=1 Tax=Rhodonia placenta TaxID=104341 RepID=A0A8H7PAP8_9APHY|nr:hypothetical protein IEO21_00778 [Postia placenta]